MLAKLSELLELLNLVVMIEGRLVEVFEKMVAFEKRRKMEKDGNLSSLNLKIVEVLIG